MGQELSRYLAIPAVQVGARVRTCELCDRKSGTEGGFLRVLRFPLPLNPQIA